MYLGTFVQMIGFPLFMGAGMALIPAGANIVILIIRTWFEDKMLMNELPGYPAYAKRTRYKLVPGVF